MIAEGRSFTGVLYAGLILTADGVKTIEFNARFGDPETQVVLPRLQSDFAEVIRAILDGEEPKIKWLESGVTLGVVLASEGYPGKVLGSHLLPEISEDLTAYYAGVSEKDGKLYSSGGRVFLVSETGEDVASTQKSVYEKLAKLNLEGMFYRHDIGSKGLAGK